MTQLKEEISQTLDRLLEQLQERGVKLWVEGSNLRYKSPVGALTPNLLEQLSRQKFAVIDFLQTAGGSKNEQPLLRRRSQSTHPSLSFAQQRLWFLDQLEANNAVYNVPIVLRMTGNLDVTALQAALSEIVRRHEVLRTHFETINGVPHQIIKPAAALDVPSIDLSDLKELEREAESKRICAETVRGSFDLATGPLFQAKLLRLTSEDHILVLVMHHIVSDGWSISVLIRELNVLYQAFIEGDPSPLPELPVQYADFAEWQRNWLRNEVLDQQLDYWKKQLGGAPSLLELPTDRPRPANQSYRGAFVTHEIPQHLLPALTELSRREGASLFMTLLAAFQTLLCRYTGQEDVAVGTVIAGRNRAEVENLIGFFVNTLVLRGDLSGDPTFRTLLARTREVALGAYAHQDLPFEKLVEVLNPERNASHSPLFQAMFVLQNAPVETLQLGGIQITPVPTNNSTSKFDLTLFIREVSGSFKAAVEYNTDLFDEQTIRRLLGHYQTLLEGIAANPEQRLSGVAMLTGAERQQILVEWNRTEAPYPKERCLHELIEAQVARTPEAVAVVFGKQQLTYRELNERANQLGHHLRRLGVGPNIMVGICVERSLEMVVGLLGILKAGGAYVPMDPEYPQERLAFMLENANAPVLLTQREFADKLRQSGTQVVCLDGDFELFASESRENPQVKLSPENLIYAIYTSGSTGNPKGAGVYHRGFINLVHWFITEFGIGPADKTLLISSLSFDLTQKNIYAALIGGGQLHLLPSGHYNPYLVADLVQQEQITLLNCTPSAFYPMIELARPESIQKLISLRHVFLGGEAISILRLRPWLESENCRAEVVNTYGPTECTDIAAYYRLNQANLDKYDFVPTGRPIPNVQLVVVNSKLQLCPQGVAGELCVAGTGVGAGYVNNTELTTAKFVSNPFPELSGQKLYKTGDLARYLPDGNIEYLGRLDHQVKIRGFRIELGEIERQLSQHSAVREAVVLAREEASDEKRLVAYLTMKNGEVPTVSELRELLRTKLPEYMVPSAFVTLERFPLNPNGKVDRKALPAPKEGQFGNRRAYDPRDYLQYVLCNFFAAALNLDWVSVKDNFFDLGGHSLLAVRLVGQINQLLHTDIHVPEFFQNPTVERLAPIVVRQLAVRPKPQLIPLRPGSPKGALIYLDAGIGLCRLAELLEGGPASFATSVLYSEDTYRAASLKLEHKLPSLEELAKIHTSLIKSQPELDPCVLVGHSFGGLLAFEVAHQLQRAGRRVEMIFLLDTWAKRVSLWQKLPILTFDRLVNSLQFRANFARKRLLTKLKHLAGRRPTECSLAEPPSKDQAGGNVSGKDMPWEILEFVFHEASKKYRRRPLQCRGVLFRSRDIVRAGTMDVTDLRTVHATLGWNGLFRQGLEIVDCPGDHFTLLKHPNLQFLADHIQANLARHDSTSKK